MTAPLPLFRRTVARLAPVEDVLRRAYPVALAFAEREVPLLRLEGVTRTGRPGAVLVAGEEPWVNYLPSLFFATVDHREPLGPVPVWRLQQRLERLRSSVDLTVVRINRFSGSLFVRGAWLTIPAWINAVLPLATDPDRASHSLKTDLRMVRRGAFEVEVTHADSDLGFFYESMYVPFMRCRHPENAFIRELSWLRQRCASGGILWILQAGQRIAGILFERRGGALRLWAEGLLRGDPMLLKMGVVAALYERVIAYARRQGYSYIDFGAVRPCLGDGLLRYKRKWGMTFGEKRDNHHSFLVRWNEWNHAVSGFFAATPLLYRGRRGLSALTSVVSSSAPATDADAASARHSSWVRGLDRICIVSDSGWSPGVQPPAGTLLLDRPAAGSHGFETLLG
jgi:hypothetical protein